jgi:antitoxin HicB
VNVAKSLEHYLSLRYRIELLQEDDAFVALHPELDGCFSHGKTPDEAVANLKEARALWIEECLDADLPIPEPGETRASGKFLVRTSRSLHRRLSELAEREGVSLNQLVNQALSEYVGVRTQAREIAQDRAEESKKLDVILSAIEDMRDSASSTTTTDDVSYYTLRQGSPGPFHTGGAYRPRPLFLASGEWNAAMLENTNGQVDVDAAGISDATTRANVIRFDDRKRA